jgi:hypothetical protein
MAISEALIQYLIVHNEQVPYLSKALWDDGVFLMYEFNDSLHNQYSSYI